MSKNAFLSHLKSADFETVCDWSTSPWRNNLDIPWCNNLANKILDDVINLWCGVKIVTPQGHVLFTAFGKPMFEYIFLYEVNQWFLNDIAEKFWKIMSFQKMINSHGVQLVNYFNTPTFILNLQKFGSNLLSWMPCNMILDNFRRRNTCWRNCLHDCVYTIPSVIVKWPEASFTKA